MADHHFLTRLRPVGLLEQFATARHSLGFYNNVGVSAFYSSLSARDFPALKHLIFVALDAVIADHPALSAVPVDEGTSAPYFARLPQINLQEATTFVSSELVLDPYNEVSIKELDRILEEQHNTGFRNQASSLPFWRTIVLYEPEKCSNVVVCFVFHHALADGTSGLAFHRAFHSALDRASSITPTFGAYCSHGNTELFARPPDRSLIPSLEDIHPLPLSITYILKSLWNDWFPTRPSTVWTGAPITADHRKRRSGFHSICFSQDTTASLLRACRSHSTTLTAVVEVLTAAAVLTELPSEYSIVRCDGAIAMRRWLPHDVVNENSIGNWVSRYVDEHRRTAGDVRARSKAIDLFSWDEARRVRKTIETELNKEGKNSVVGLLKYAGDLHQRFKGKIGKDRDETFEISNIGVYKSGVAEDKDCEWKVGRVVFSQCADVCGPAIGVSLVTGGDGCLNIGLSWLEGIVEGVWMEQMMRTLRQVVEEISRSG
ncbi:Alcohol acetyltransferase [Elasticomyces elasticus]|uniref:Alcohol acetyltransferase n=1 Tax=Exophiala sideris TaxID=1016849 RepID=A0ABR0J6C2_9EURO|nr:Alcohol acetyltransferase [Elasticomyces elasticus]KAK5023535.1 Alcohol acetyltransferase [Exophiala sideris]KAK5028671.1 Alcohol acetyltransferase [Exophiala sideris]KAK5057175.1 Alcohol acetyltransferase [Exophiala sideris]KAK5181852.1 Alcohol acetyltransferase [Eurotiomycetes sp. CCFEE 6388]